MQISMILSLALLAVSPGFATDKSVDTPPLKAIHKLYIEKMDNNLDQYLRAEIVKQFKGKLTVVLQINDADAILTGVNTEEKGTGAKVTGRYLGLHDVATGTVSLLDKEGKTLLW